MIKTCSRCQEAKEISNFYRQTALRPNDDGYDYYCKSCRNKSSYQSWKHNKHRCTTEGCDKANYSRELCRVHYNKFMRHKKKRDKNAKTMLQPYPPQGADNA
jgi:hypothetical protein